MTVPGQGSFLELHTGRNHTDAGRLHLGPSTRLRSLPPDGHQSHARSRPEIGSFPTIREGWERKLEVGQGGRELHTTRHWASAIPRR